MPCLFNGVMCCALTVLCYTVLAVILGTQDMLLAGVWQQQSPSKHRKVHCESHTQDAQRHSSTAVLDEAHCVRAACLSHNIPEVCAAEQYQACSIAAQFEVSDTCDKLN